MLNSKVKIIYRDTQKMIFRVFPDEPRLNYRAGQYAALGLYAVRKDEPPAAVPDGSEGTLIKRAYSVSSSLFDENHNLLTPGQSDYYEFYVDRVPADETQKPRLSARLFALKDDDRIFIGSKIVGHYTLQDVEPQKNLLLIGTTTAEAPHNAMIIEALHQNPRRAISHVVIGPSAWQSAYALRHERLMSQYPRYRWWPLADEPLYENIIRFFEESFVDKEEARKYFAHELDPRDTDVFLCGDPRLIGAPVKLGSWRYEYPSYGLIRIFDREGFHLATRFQPGELHYESYW